MGLETGVSDILAIIRRYAEAIAAGRLEAAQIKGMTDEELAAFDDALNAKMKDEQAKNRELEAGNGEKI